ncbi:hypothetical protein, partial [Halorubrum sp. SD626R]|uniref:hypothetical protein n=1 Tax=Halorubrum sp. SD626R TaxID=1419722 RepID=UPI0018EE801F
MPESVAPVSVMVTVTSRSGSIGMLSAAMLSDDESEAQAISALAALNIPIDPEREVTVTITETGATLS